MVEKAVKTEKTEVAETGADVGAKAEKRLVLIDGKSVFYRGYYAMGPLALPDGTPTGGLYGFAAIAMEVVRKIAPTKVVVAWDSPTSVSKRRALYPEYKSGRVKPGEDFYAQIPLLRELVAALGWNFVEIDDYEADDIIGTLSLQADETLDAKGRCEYETFIISSDLDMLQIVDENTHMWRILKGFSKIEQIDVAEVEEKYGIKKAQFLDLKALKGDASDKIPGVPGVGEKTAAKLLNEYGNLDGVYEHVGEIGGAVGKKLVAGKESAYMSKRLAEIMFDAPVELSKLKDFEFDKDRTIAGLRKLGFNSLIRKLEKELGEDGGGSNPSFSSSPAFSPVVTGKMPACSPVGSHTQKMKGLNSAYSHAQEKKGLDSASPINNSSGLKSVIDLPETPDNILIAWDVKGAMHGDDKLAEEVLNGRPFWDLAQAAFLLNPLEKQEPQLVVPEKLYQEQREAFSHEPELYHILTDFDLPLIPILYKMEKKGMLLDRRYFAKMQKEYEAEVGRLEQEIWQLAGKEFNVNSPIQLSEVLFSDLALPTKGIKKTARGYSTGVKELEKLRDLHPIIEKIFAYREASKLLSTYIIPMPGLADAEGRVHTTFTQNVTATGRLSSHDPNLQNIPVRTDEGRRIRGGFVAPEGRRLVSADYSQFELRLAAVMSGDAALVADFNSGVDIHTKTAAEAFHVPLDKVSKAQRRAAKVINFGVLYGMSIPGLAAAADMSTAEAKQFIDRYFELRAPIKKQLEEYLRQAREQGYVQTLYGRRRMTPDVKSPTFLVRQAAERAAQNMPIQGTEADLMKRAMIRVDAALPKGADLVMQVHDSLIVECDAEVVSEVSKILKREMEGVAPELEVKLAVEVTEGENWGEL